MLERPVWSRHMSPYEMSDATAALIDAVEATPADADFPADEDAPVPEDDGRYLGPCPRAVRNHQLTWLGRRNLSTASDDELQLDLFDDDLHSSAVVEGYDAVR